MTGTAAPLPADTGIGCVRLRVASLERALDFYRDLLGFRVLRQDEGRVTLSPGGDPPGLIALEEHPGIQRRQEGTPGLYHFAILLPDRLELGRTLLHLFEHRVPFQGFADHGVSEAAYLADPDGNGIELYADRPRDQWPRDETGLVMFTHTLNVTALLRLIDGDPWLGLPAATRMGHIHLHVADLAAAEAFYADTLGLDVTTRRYPGALFLAAGGYHHHVAVNVWARGRTRPADATVAGLDAFDLVVPDAGARAALVERLHARGTETAADGDATRIADPENNRIRIRGPA